VPAHLGLAVVGSVCAAHRSIAFGQHHLAEAGLVDTSVAAGSLAEVVDTALVIAVVGRDRGCPVGAAVRTHRTAAHWAEGSDHATQYAPGRTLEPDC